MRRRRRPVQVTRPLLVGPNPVAACEIADTYRSRARGLLGRDGLDGAILLDPASSVHTFGMRFAIDVAYCDRDLRVLDVVTMVPNRLGRPRPRARVVLEAEAGAFARWGVAAGVRLHLAGPAEGSPGPARRGPGPVPTGPR